MKRNTYNILLLAVALLAAVSSCRQDNDEVGYVNGAGLAELDAVKYAQKWDVMWKAYNQSYVGWDIETVDWDEQNAKFRPQFVEIDDKVDELSKAETPDTAALNALSRKAHELYTEALDTLHDGHTAVVYLDHVMGNRSKLVYPNRDRRMKYDDSNDAAPEFEKHYYIETSKDIAKYSYISPGFLLAHFLTEKYIPLMQSECEQEGIDDSTRICIEQLCATLSDAISNIDPSEPKDYDSFLDYYKTLMKDEIYQGLASAFGFAINENFENTATGIETFISKDGIAGYRLKAFDLPVAMDSTYSNDISGAAAKYIHDALFAWRDTVYAMHDKGQLKGVILDVRHNGGGYLANLGYFSGLLFKGDKYNFCTVLQKNGIGRLDYTAPREKSFGLPAKNDEDITEPIVILTDANSISCAEVSTIAVKQHSNGVSIGTRTWGGGCVLINDYRLNPAFGYSGNVGIMSTTPVFAYIPNYLVVFNKFGTIEGKGVSPDIEVRFDSDLYKQTGRDNQFERALEYLRSNK